jgi:hypothetical protein
LVVFASVRADEKISAPVPKDPPPQSIEGNYNLLATFNGDRMVGPGGRVAKGGGGGGPAGAFGADGTLVRSPRGEATISKSEITLERPATSAAPTIMDYTFNPTKTPMTIDVETFTLRGKKTKSLGIVEVIGNRVIIALAPEGEDRPKTVDEAEGVTIYYLQKVPPPPKTEFRIVALTAGKEEAAEKELNKLSQEGYQLVSTTNPIATDPKGTVTTIHFVLKRTVKQP